MKYLAILFIIFSTPVYGVSRIYDRSSGVIVDADKDDAEWDNTNSAINTHIADTSAHDATGGVVGASKSQNISNKTFVGDVPIVSAGDVLIYSSSTAGTLVASIDGTTGGFIGAPIRLGTYNISIARGTTSVAGDTVKIQCGGAACSASNPGYFVLYSAATAGDLTIFKITADITRSLTGATWGFAGKGDITGELLRVIAANDNGSLRICVAYLGGRNIAVAADSTATASSASTPESLLCNTAIGSSSNTLYEIGFVRADFDDSGGSSEDLHTIQSGIDDVVTGKTADGMYQPWNTTLAGFSANPTINLARWTQHGLNVCIQTDISANGTSNATTYTMTVPVKANGVQGGLAMQPVDNGTNGVAAGWRTANDSTTINVYRTLNDDSWTGSGTKNAEPIGCYEAIP